jgi:hypothetical protein
MSKGTLDEGSRLVCCRSTPEFVRVPPSTNSHDTRHSNTRTLLSTNPCDTITPNTPRPAQHQVTMSSKPAVPPRADRSSFITKIAWLGFKLGFGLTSLASVWATAVLKNGALWAKDTEGEKQELAAAQQQYWSLDREPLSGFRHAFFTTSTGAQLHFVSNADPETVQPKNIAIFIHGMSSARFPGIGEEFADPPTTGFPDSFVLWRHILQSPELQRSHVLIAVDLPGYGGSDSLPTYGPCEMLETMTEFILDIRKQHLHAHRKVVVVTHDWGALIGARLASEASQLADRWIITSGIIVR